MTFLVELRPYVSPVQRFVCRGATVILTVSLCLGALGVARMALADPIPMTSVFLNMQAAVCGPSCGAPLNVTYNPSTDNGPTTLPGQSLSAGATNNLFGQGFADLGLLGVLAEADSQSSSISDGNLSALTSASFSEPFTITSPTLAPGTTVKAKTVIVMDGLVDVSQGAISPDPGGAGTTAQWNFSLVMQSLNPANATSVTCDNLAVDCGILPGIPFELSTPFVFSFVVGDVDIVTGQLVAGATATSFANEEGAFASSSVTAAALETAKFYLQPLDDFTLVSFSGHDYSLPGGGGGGGGGSTAVPEPASVLLVAIGLSALIVRRRGSRH